MGIVVEGWIGKAGLWSLIRSPGFWNATWKKGWKLWENFLALHTGESGEFWRPELHTDALCEFQNVNFGCDIETNFTNTSVLKAKPV